MASIPVSSGQLLPSSYTHRLPTISASEAFRQLRESGSRTIPTGLDELDKTLAGQSISSYGRGGLVRGHLTEVFGPPGCGKTAFAIQVASNALREDGHVVWIDCAASLPHPRLRNKIHYLDEAAIKRFHHYNIPTLAHLLALVHHNKTEFPPKGTSLIVVDDVTVLFPPSKSVSKPPSTPRPTSVTLQSTLLSAFGKIAASHNVAVLINSYVSTRIRHTGGAILVATHGSKEWDDQLSSRMVFFRDFPPRTPGKSCCSSLQQGDLLAKLRFAGIIKAHGLSAIENDTFNNVVPFSMSNGGSLLPVTLRSGAEAPSIQSPGRARKRVLDQVADSEDDWDEELQSLDGYDWSDPEIQTNDSKSHPDPEKDNKKQKLDTDVKGDTR